MNPKLELLKQALHPEKPMNIIDQCEIVGEALASGGEFAMNGRKLAGFLGISINKVYKMNRVCTDMIPEAKEIFRAVNYQANSAYAVASQTKEGQIQFVEEYRKKAAQIESKKNS